MELNKLYLIIILSALVLIPSSVFAFKTFENQQVTIREVTYKTGSLIAVEDAICGDDGANVFGCKFQPTIANEFRGYSGRTVSGVQSPYTLQLNYIDEQKAVFTIQNTITLDPRLIISGSQLDRVEMNGANVPLGTLWVYNSVQQFNRINLFEGVTLANSLTVYFPQNNFTQFATQGRLIEGNFVNNLSRDDIDKFVSILELFNPDSKKLDRLIDILENDREKIYNIILKSLLNRFQDTDNKRGDALRHFLDLYRNEPSLISFLNKLESHTRTVTDIDVVDNDPI